MNNNPSKIKHDNDLKHKRIKYKIIVFLDKPDTVRV